LERRKEYDEMVKASMRERKAELKEEASKQGASKGLNKSQMDKVNKEMKQGGDRDVLLQKYGIDISRGDLRLLADGEWLNDEVVNFYVQMLMERNNAKGYPKTFIFNTHFYSMILSKGKYDYSKVRRWTTKQKLDVFSLAKVLVPVHLGTHWCLAIVNFKQKRFEYYDSLGADNSVCIKTLRQWVEDESQDKRKKAFDFTGWTNYTPKDIPMQQNGYDCGVFMCKFADFASRDESFSFSQENMRSFRQLIAFELLSGQMLE